MLVTAAASLAFTATYLLTGRLWMPIGMHFAWNYLFSAVFSIVVSGHEAKGWIRGEMSGGAEWLSGGAYGIEGSAMALVAWTAAAALLLHRAHIRGKLLKGADFATTAKTYSQDSHAEDGGAWDWMPRDQMKPSIANVAFELKTGGLSHVIDDDAAYIIIACDAIKYGTPEPLTKVRPDIERAISSEKSKVVIEKWMVGLRKKATIKKYGWN